MKIYTLTLNPAFDVHAAGAAFAACKENFVSVTSRDAGGKGVNISRALQQAGVENKAIVVLGRENGADFRQALAQFGLDAVYIEKEGRIRENLTVHHDGGETRISFSGFCVDDSLLDEVAAVMEADADTVLTFTGSISDGISMDAAKAFLCSLKQKGVKIVLDCRSFTLADIQQVKPWLVKPNQQEVSQWFDMPVQTLQEAAVCAQRLHEMGVENAMVSMGQLGACLYNGKLHTAAAPKIACVSTIGAGDGSLAGFLYGLCHGEEAYGCLRCAVAFGSAACLTSGTQPPAITDIQRFLA